MARTRFIKPGFFDNEVLASLSPHCRLLFIGLWTIADRDGKLDDRPPRIKAKLFPYEEVNVEEMLQVLNQHGFILRYEVQEVRYILIPMFKKHQSPHPKEQRSTIPEPIACHRQVIGKSMTSTGISGTCQASYPSIFQSSNGESVTSHRQASDKPMTIKDQQLSDRFHEWIEEYPNPTKIETAARAWINLIDRGEIHEGNIEEVFEGLRRYKQSAAWAKENGKWICEPTTFLIGNEKHGGRMWMDRPAPAKAQVFDMPDTDVYDKQWREEHGL